MSTGITAQGGTDRLNRIWRLYHSTSAENFRDGRRFDGATAAPTESFRQHRVRNTTGFGFPALFPTWIKARFAIVLIQELQRDDPRSGQIPFRIPVATTRV